MLDRDNAGQYPPNVQAMAPASGYVGQELLAVDAEAGTAEIAYTLDERHLNRYGAIHGGVTALVMDDIFSVASGLTIAWGQIVPTLEMKVSYLAGAKPGRVIAKARVVKRGRQVIFVEASLADAEGKLLATATATMMVAQMKRG